MAIGTRIPIRLEDMAVLQSELRNAARAIEMAQTAQLCARRAVAEYTALAENLYPAIHGWVWDFDVSNKKKPVFVLIREEGIDPRSKEPSP